MNRFPPRPRSRPALVAALAILAAGLFTWWLLEGFLSPPSPEPATVRGPGTEQGEGVQRFALLLNPLEAVEAEAVGEGVGDRATTIHSVLVRELRDSSGWQVVTGEISTPPGSGRRGGSGIEGVEAVLSGELVHEGERLHLTLRLSAAPSGEALWSGSYQGRAGALEELARTAARSLARELALYGELLAEPR